MGLRNLEMRSLDCLEIGSGVAWTAQIYDKKERVLFSAENHGRGGGNLYKVDGAKMSESNRYIEDLENEARMELGMELEALDMVMAYLEPEGDIIEVIERLRLEATVCPCCFNDERTCKCEHP
jgi:hypothetical protein